jgi:HlyD family secretion protein
MNVSETPGQVSVPNFKPGMSATVDIKTNTVTNVVSVPIQAVTVRDFADDEAPSDTTATDATDATDENGIGEDEDFRKVVFINDDGTAKRMQVETGISDNAYIQIMSGIDAGDEVVTGSYRILSRELEDGDPITVSSSN